LPQVANRSHVDTHSLSVWNEKDYSLAADGQATLDSVVIH